MRQEGIIVGGGAAGLLAAITAAENGASITILEHMPRVGKKILSTGNGKCNMTNLHMTADCYRSGVAGVPMKVIETFSVDDTIAFFRRLGVLTMDRNGYVYPASGQAQTVLDALRDKADSLGVRTCC
ncbi:MAG: NAD(P)/FAD-dependent oxidoreductase, partial [Lachnospiraceae bacterium]|nr:NAD(P)/FAD-dependent oxidoreductase [Lachnospiraceae bacterium]